MILKILKKEVIYNGERGWTVESIKAHYRDKDNWGRPMGESRTITVRIKKPDPYYEDGFDFEDIYFDSDEDYYEFSVGMKKRRSLGHPNFHISFQLVT